MQDAINGRTAVVVGAGSGLGRAAARALARQGARVVLVDVDGARLERAANELTRHGAQGVLLLQADIRSDRQVAALVRDAEAAAPDGVDILVNCAGVLLQGPVEKIKGSDWEWMLETNLLGTVRTTTAFLPHFLARGRGHVVNAVSGAGLFTPELIHVAYDAGHAAVLTFSEGLAARLAGTGVAVSVLVIGSHGHRIGQNSRSRGLAAWLAGAPGPAPAGPQPSTVRLLDHLGQRVVDAVRGAGFLVLGMAEDRDALDGRWRRLADAPTAADAPASAEAAAG